MLAGVYACRASVINQKLMGWASLATAGTGNDAVFGNLLEERVDLFRAVFSGWLEFAVVGCANLASVWREKHCRRNPFIESDVERFGDVQVLIKLAHIHFQNHKVLLEVIARLAFLEIVGKNNAVFTPSWLRTRP